MVTNHPMWLKHTGSERADAYRPAAVYCYCGCGSCPPLSDVHRGGKSPRQESLLPFSRANRWSSDLVLQSPQRCQLSLVSSVRASHRRKKSHSISYRNNPYITGGEKASLFSWKLCDAIRFYSTEDDIAP